MIIIIQMVGATMEQKENAEASTRLSEDRFRSLIQNSSDVTLVILPGGTCATQSGRRRAHGFRAGRSHRHHRQEFVHPEEQECVLERWGRSCRT